MNAKPIFRWAGGKTQLLNVLMQHVPENYGTYYEPFFGGGALFFRLNPRNAWLNDLNAALMHTYHLLTISTNDVISQAANWIYDFEESQFYALRDRFNELQDDELHFQSSPAAVELAALFIYLNRTCFNGLWRENRSGHYNTPIGKFGTAPSLDVLNAYVVAKAFKHATITALDFEEVLHGAGRDDLVYLDSPYDKLDNGSFTSFTANNFTHIDQQRLALTVHKLVERNAYVIVSNNDTPLVREFYNGLNFIELHERRSINADTEKRGGNKTVLITNIEPTK